jgi:hypothetical protein
MTRTSVLVIAATRCSETADYFYLFINSIRKSSLMKDALFILQRNTSALRL